MREISLPYFNKIADGLNPFIYLTITTPMGDRVYSNKVLDMLDVQTDLLTEDGQNLITETGISLAGLIVDFSFGSLSNEDRVLRFGSIASEIVPRKNDLLQSRNFKRQQTASIELENADYGITKLMGTEPFINQKVAMFAGFDDMSSDNHLKLFAGEIKRVSVNETTATLEVHEDSDALLAETYYLKRAELYANPADKNAILPIIYGDLTDGLQGNWLLPLIDTVNFIYAFSAHEVLSVANGNSINIYADDVLVSPSNYVFNESNNMESQGVIATIDFIADQGNAKITARGRGKPTVTSGATLMTNVADIVYDFLTVEVGLAPSRIHTTSKKIMSDKFDAQSYKAAGAVVKDQSAWETIQTMMGSFLGSVYQNSDGFIFFELDDGSTPTVAEIIPVSDIEIKEAFLRSENIVNRCPMNYQFRYQSNEFAAVADTAAAFDQSSINIYGTRKPKKPFQALWCRDATSIATIQAIIINRQKQPTWEIEFNINNPNYYHLDAGDAVGIRADQLFDSDNIAFTQQIVKLVSLKPDYDRLTGRYRGLDMKTKYQTYATHALLAEDNQELLTESNEQLLGEVFQ